TGGGRDSRRAPPPDRPHLLRPGARGALRERDRLGGRGCVARRTDGGGRPRHGGDRRWRLLPVPARRLRLLGWPHPAERAGRELVVLDALEHDPLGLDRHLERAVAFPVLGVGRVVLDRRVEPDAVALLVALVGGGFEGAAAPTAASATTRATSPAPALAVLIAVRVAFVLVGRALFLLGLGLAELRLDLGLDLVAEIDVVVGFLALCGQAVPVPEITQLGGRNPDLMGDPGVGAALAHPGTDLVQLWSQRRSGHPALTLVNRTFVPWHDRAKCVGSLILGRR